MGAVIGLSPTVAAFAPEGPPSLASSCARLKVIKGTLEVSSQLFGRFVESRFNATVFIRFSERLFSLFRAERPSKRPVRQLRYRPDFFKLLRLVVVRLIC